VHEAFHGSEKANYIKSTLSEVHRIRKKGKFKELILI